MMVKKEKAFWIVKHVLVIICDSTEAILNNILKLFLWNYRKKTVVNMWGKYNSIVRFVV